MYMLQWRPLPNVYWAIHGCEITLYVDCVLCLLQKVFVILAVAVVVVMIIVSSIILYYRVYANKAQDLIGEKIRILRLLIVQLNVECDDLYQKFTQKL